MKLTIYKRNIDRKDRSDERIFVSQRRSVLIHSLFNSMSSVQLVKRPLGINYRVEMGISFALMEIAIGINR